jgi:uncharacterized membrane protein
MIKVQELMKSRRFWVAVSGVVLVVGNEGLGLKLTEDQVTLVVTMLASWVVGDSFRKTGE